MMMSFDARTWIAWVIAAAAITIVARNPFYTLSMLLAVSLVAKMCAGPGSSNGLPVARLSVFILLFATLFNGLSIHVGETVLFRLPSTWPWIGGHITLEAAVFGFSVGLVLVTLLFTFSTFNAILPTSDLVRLMPRAMRDLGVVILIAITYIPETTRQLKRIREAQAIRGHRLRTVKDWGPILIPLLIGGLERAMGLAEAMVSRGYGATADVRQPFIVQIGLFAGLLLALAGWVLTFWISWTGWLLLAAGALIVGLLLLRIGRSTPHTRYRPRRWKVGDTAILAIVAVSISLVFAPLPFVDRLTLTYAPFPTLDFPAYEPFIGLAVFLLATPALFTTVK
jgi:energy-coupling factor transport system permease protein